MLTFTSGLNDTRALVDPRRSAARPPSSPDCREDVALLLRDSCAVEPGEAGSVKAVVFEVVFPRFDLEKNTTTDRSTRLPRDFDGAGATAEVAKSPGIVLLRTSLGFPHWSWLIESRWAYASIPRRDILKRCAAAVLLVFLVVRELRINYSKHTGAGKGKGSRRAVKAEGRGAVTLCVGTAVFADSRQTYSGQARQKLRRAGIHSTLEWNGIENKTAAFCIYQSMHVDYAVGHFFCIRIDIAISSFSH